MNISRAFLCCLSSLTAMTYGTVVSAADSKPNIVVILADDLGYGDVGFNGSKEIFTPRLDSLAKNGAIFKNGYVTHPYCGPSRAGLVTGRYQARFGQEINVTYSPYDRTMGLPLTERTFGSRLQKAGYRTGIIGKWHLGASPEYHPNNRGFDHFYGFLSGGHTYFPHNVTNNFSLILPKNGKPHYSANEGCYLPLVRNNGAGELKEYLTTALSRDAAEFVKDSKKPFCLYLAYNAPHGPLEAPKSYIDKYTHIKDKRRRTYAAMIDAMDEGIGMVIDALKESGKYDNTLIFFLSDNGGVTSKPGHKNETWSNNGPFRKGKGSMLEGGSHVPFIAHWPAKIKKGTVIDGLISSLDIAATAVAIGDGDTSGHKLEGVNLEPYFTGEKTDSPHEALYWRVNNGSAWCIRTVNGKYLKENWGTKGGNQLYDMSNDPYEANNIVKQRPEMRAELAKMWNAWNAENIANIHLQAGTYQKKRLKMYEELYEEQKRQAAKRKKLIIK